MPKHKQVVPLDNSLLPDDVFSFFDDQFSIDTLQKAVETKEAESNRIISSIQNVVKKYSQYSEQDEEPKLVVVLTDQQAQDYRDHKLRLDKASGDEYYAQLRDENGHYSDKLTVKEELQDQGISAEELKLALQMDAIRNQLEEILDSLKSIESGVTQVYQGQRNDRLGLYYSGLSLYIESKGINDPAMRMQIESQALKSISDANSQMIQELRTSLEYLLLKKYIKLKNATEKIDEHLSVIHQCYDIIYRSSVLKAMIYFENGEITAMLTAIDEYSRFVEKLIVPYAGILSELDKHEQFIEKGTWGKISKTLGNCRDMKNRIAMDNVYYIPLKEERDAG